MTTNNYQSVDDADDQAVGEIQFFSPGARINRLRYWAHSALIVIPLYIIAVIGIALALSVSSAFWAVVVVAYIAMIAGSFLIMIQRLHDLDKSGWMSLLAIIPLANLYLMILLIFFEGTKGRNRFGLRTPPNKTWHWIIAFVMPILSTVGILAAIAIPQYHKYVERVKHQQEASQVMDLPTGIEESEAASGDAEGQVEGVSAGEESAVRESAVTEPESEAPVVEESSESSKAPE